MGPLLRPAAAAVALLAASSTVLGESFLDRVPPEPTVAKWIAGDPAPSWKALQGRSLLLELTDPDDLVCDGLISRTAEFAARAAASRLVVVTVAVGAGAHEGTARSWAERRKVGWSFGIDRGGATLSSLGVTGLPWTLLLAPDGRVVWEGSTADLTDAELDRHLARARLWRPAEVAKVMRPAAAAFAAARYGEAVRLAREAMEGVEKRTRNALPVEGGEEKDRALLEDAVKSIAEARFTLAARLERERHSLDCLELLEGVERGFAGTSWAEEAKKRREALFASEKHAREIEQGRRLREILAKARTTHRPTLEKVLEDLDLFIEHNVNMRILIRARPERDRIQALLDPKGTTRGR